MLYESILVLAGLVVGSVAAWLIAKSKLTRAAINGSRLEERAQNLEKGLSESRSELEKERQSLGLAQEQLVRQQAETGFLNEKLQTEKAEIENMQKKLTVEFENLANRILDEKSKKFTTQNQENLDGILKPLGVKIGEFQKKVEEVYVEENKQRFALEGEIKRLYELSQQVTKEASNLTNALTGSSKIQGNWGQMVLEKILEHAGLQKGREFLVQKSMATEDGKRQIPDVVVQLPEARSIVVDSKVSLTAYERYCSAETDEDREAALKAHIGSVRRHINELSAKNYQDLYEINAPDQVLMFMPVEPAFNLAARTEPGLFYEAMEKRVAFIGPSSLLATLKTIASVWQYEKQNRNAMEIARKAGALYDKFCGFVDSLKEVGKKIADATRAHEDALAKLSTGKGNLVRSVESIKELGAKAKKALPKDLVGEEGEDG